MKKIILLIIMFFPMIVLGKGENYEDVCGDDGSYCFPVCTWKEDKDNNALEAQILKKKSGDNIENGFWIYVSDKNFVASDLYPIVNQIDDFDCKQYFHHTDVIVSSTWGNGWFTETGFTMSDKETKDEINFDMDRYLYVNGVFYNGNDITAKRETVEQYTWGNGADFERKYILKFDYRDKVKLEKKNLKEAVDIILGKYRNEYEDPNIEKCEKFDGEHNEDRETFSKQISDEISAIYNKFLNNSEINNYIMGSLISQDDLEEDEDSTRKREDTLKYIENQCKTVLKDIVPVEIIDQEFEKVEGSINNTLAEIIFEHIPIFIPEVRPMDCESLLGSPTTPNSTAYYISFAFKVIRYVAIILLIVVTTMDFISAVSSQDNDIIKKAVNKAIVRMVICVVIFLLPTLIQFILQIINDKQIDLCISEFN